MNLLQNKLFFQGWQTECDLIQHFHSLQILSRVDLVHYMPEEKANLLKGRAVCYATSGPWGDFYCLTNDDSICRTGKNFLHTSFQFHCRIFIKWGIWAFCHMIYSVKHVTKAFSLFSVGAEQNFSMASPTLLLNMSSSLNPLLLSHYDRIKWLFFRLSSNFV